MLLNGVSRQGKDRRGFRPNGWVYGQQLRAARHALPCVLLASSGNIVANQWPLFTIALWNASSAGHKTSLSKSRSKTQLRATPTLSCAGWPNPSLVGSLSGAIVPARGLPFWPTIIPAGRPLTWGSLLRGVLLFLWTQPSMPIR